MNAITPEKVLLGLETYSRRFYSGASVAKLALVHSYNVANSRVATSTVGVNKVGETLSRSKQLNFGWTSSGIVSA